MEPIINYIKEKYSEFMNVIKIDDDKIIVNQDRYLIFMEGKYVICKRKYTSYDSWIYEPIASSGTNIIEIDDDIMENTINKMCQHNYMLYVLKQKK